MVDEKRRSFLKLGLGLLAGAVSAPVGLNLLFPKFDETSKSFNDSMKSGVIVRNKKKEITNFDYFKNIVNKIDSGVKLEFKEEDFVFRLLINIWKEFSNPSKKKGLNYNQRKVYINNLIKEYEGAVISILIYFSHLRVNWYREGGFILNDRGNIFFSKYKLNKRFLEELRIIFYMNRHHYMTPRSRRFLLNQEMQIKERLNNDIFNFKKSAEKVYQEVLLKNPEANNINELVNKNILFQIFDNKIPNNIVSSLIQTRTLISSNEVFKKGIFNFIFNRNHKLINIEIDFLKFNSVALSILNKYSKEYNIDIMILVTICFVETNFGINNKVSSGQARGLLQVKESAYDQNMDENKFPYLKASQEQWVEAGVKKLIKDMKLTYIDKDKIQFIDIIIIGMFYNGGIEEFFKLYKIGFKEVSPETFNYYHYLLILSDDFFCNKC